MKPDRSALFCDRFEVIENCMGGMADVLVCKDVHNGKIVAAKSPHFAFELFSRESRMWLGLDQHPNIVKAHVVHNIANRPFLFMDFVGDAEGKSQNFRQALIKSSNPKNLILNVGMAVVNALEHAISIYPGFVHRDIKPENILIDSNENAYLTDFGIGHIPRLELTVDINNDRLENVTGKTLYTKTGGFIGTWGYSSPEQYFDSSTVNFKSDIYSLGIVLFEALFGSLPYDPELIAQNGYKHLLKPIEIHRSLSSDFETQMYPLIKRMLQFSARNRPGSLESLKNNFEIIQQRSHCHNKPPKSYHFKEVQNHITENIYANRIYSFIELGENELAIANLTKFQKRFPFSQRTKTFVRKLFHKLPEDYGWPFFKKITKTEFSHPKILISTTVVLLLIAGPPILLSIISEISKSFVFLGVLLLVVLFIEKYINTRTSITLDRITLFGIVIGYFFTFIFGLFNMQTLAGSTGRSIIGSLIGLIVPLSIAWVYKLKTGKEGIGGGTIKLSAMIGSWTGLMIIPIIIIALLIQAFQGLFVGLIHLLPGELKWSADTLVPRLHRSMSISIPTSTSFFISTWIAVIYLGIKIVNESFLKNLDWLLDRFLTF